MSKYRLLKFVLVFSAVLLVAGGCSFWKNSGPEQGEGAGKKVVLVPTPTPTVTMPGSATTESGTIRRVPTVEKQREDTGSLGMTQWQTYHHPAASFEYPIDWNVFESQGGLQIRHPTDSTTSIQIFYGSAQAARNTDICYTHSEFKYGDLVGDRNRDVLITRDGIEVSKYLATDDEGRSFYYACQADKRTSYEAVSHGRVPEQLFDHIVFSFHFTLLEPVELWKTYHFGNVISFSLPPTVPEPTCHQSLCFSEGTFLPGGTWLNLALRGKEQYLSDSLERFAEELQKTDLYQSQMTIHGRKSIFFTGNLQPQESLTPLSPFGGQTIYIKGYGIEVDKNVFIEVTITTPEGAQADQHADEQLLSEIIQQIKFVQLTSEN